MRRGGVKECYQVTIKKQIFSFGELKRIMGTLTGHGMLLEKI
jgi:hypothetical protein